MDFSTMPYALNSLIKSLLPNVHTTTHDICESIDATWNPTSRQGPIRLASGSIGQTLATLEFQTNVKFLKAA